MALLSIDMIREIQGIADIYAARERARVARASAAAEQRATPARTRRPREEAES